MRWRLTSAVGMAVATGTVTAFAPVQATPAPPRAGEPKAAKTGGPPPAWIASTRASSWLSYGTYCWAGRCVYYPAPALRTNIPTIRVARGATLTLHFGFTPKSLAAGYVKEGAPPRPLTPARATRWRPRSSGRFEIETHAAAGYASYVGIVQISG